MAAAGRALDGPAGRRVPRHHRDHLQLRPRRRRAEPGRARATGEFPVSLAEAYATEFGRVYLGFSPQSLGQREQALAAFVPPAVSAANPSLGWNGVGQLNLQSLQVAGIKVQDPQHAVVTLLALLSGQLMELGVPVAAAGSGLVGHRRARLAARAAADFAADRPRAARTGWPKASS